MRFLFYAAVFGLPVLDIATLVEVGGLIGAWPTTGLVLLSATIGVMLVRAQGFAILTQARANSEPRKLPRSGSVRRRVRSDRRRFARAARLRLRSARDISARATGPLSRTPRDRPAYPPFRPLRDPAGRAAASSWARRRPGDRRRIRERRTGGREETAASRRRRGAAARITLAWVGRESECTRSLRAPVVRTPPRRRIDAEGVRRGRGRPFPVDARRGLSRLAGVAAVAMRCAAENPRPQRITEPAPQ